jgi:hypothetical protein
MLTVNGTAGQRLGAVAMIAPVGNCVCLYVQQGKPIKLEHDQRIEADRGGPRTAPPLTSLPPCYCWAGTQLSGFS